MSQVQPQLSADGRFYWDGQTWKPVPSRTAASVSRIQGLLVLAGSALIVTSTFLPWLTASAPFVGTINRSLTDLTSDGPMLAVGGAIVLLIGLAMAVRGPMLGVAVGAIVVLALVALLVVYDYSQVSSRVANVTSSSDLIIASVGAGPYVAGFGIFLAAVGSAMALFRRSPVGSTAPSIESQPQPEEAATPPMVEAVPPTQAGVGLGVHSGDGLWYWNGERWLPNS